ncbi:CDP-glycerol glycerophosphotransferase family protein [Mesobacillus maritimus]|uniref:CDP-glycerol glycerophosphotransferase family protein n=1 Tax=Mesobacillus maritimus TaxID=1643336 RepID=UPI00203E720A|nr:CDP-glycerol glycerophosphotransferase family protein [Mesobacillus maritimus]MCM3585192.1 CDP-glycerol glycerophosphotransferase family protein [Mesobacillus maritimus]
MIFRKKSKPKRRRSALKHSIHLTQDNGKLSLVGKLGLEHYTVTQLCLAIRDSEEKFTIAENNLSGAQFRFDLSLSSLIEKLCVDDEPKVFDFFLKIKVPTDTLSEKGLTKLEDRAEFFEENYRQYAEYFIRLGRFQHTILEGLEYVASPNGRGLCYVTTKGNLSFALNEEPESPTKIQIDFVRKVPNGLKIEGKLFTRNSRILNGKILMKGRNNNQELVADATFQWGEEQTSLKYGLNRYEYTATIDFSSINNGKLVEEDIYDLFLRLNFHDRSEEKDVRIGRPAFRARHFIKETSAAQDNQVAIVSPYYTFKASNLSLEVYAYDKETFDFLQGKLRFAWFHRLMNKRKNVWIVGERPYKAQDTGYHFFKYMRENHPEKNVYYVIEEGSPERRNVDPLGNVLFFKSKEHIWQTLISTRVISSHHPDYLYPLRTKRFNRAVKAIKVFLQHGVMGTKNMVANYGKKARGFNTDLFLVSSTFEKEMIVNDFGYDPNEVFITGLSRFDKLFAEDVPLKKQILIIPTWRDWIVTDDQFLESEYFERYKELILHPELHRLARENDLELVFCLHPNMQKFTDYFRNAPVKVISQGEVDVQHLLKESAIMITDYSSVAFDFSFLHKPIIYYQFDRSRFIGKRPSHLNLDEDLPGDIVDSFDGILSCLEDYVQNGLQMKEENRKRSEKFLDFRDRNSSKRIFEVVKNANIDKPLLKRLYESSLYIALFNRFRKSKWYFPSMKAFYKLARTFMPIEKDLILFESGVGKQYADSPRNIYEEIVARDLPYKKVWVYNSNNRFHDPNTKKIKRLSPEYYYYLARAGYWVNNQNFPAYIKKRKGTTYIQTWHGTPLKKMLFDIENIQGRDEGYLERIHGATKNWDYLISPSEYATKAFRSAFRYEGEVLEIGYPRNDIFYKPGLEQISRNVKQKLKLPLDKKVILYAPTFRDNQTSSNNKFTFNLNMDLDALKDSLGDEYILLMRMHVVISSKLVIPEELQEFVYNVSSYPDIQDLYLISDILMTDYSSVMFDFANTDRPILFFTYDLEEYKNDVRGFYMDFEQEAPGPLLFDTGDIIQSVQNIHTVKKDYSSKYEAFKNKYCPLEDGNATNRVVDRFFDEKG